jgi:hypothetical protein
MALKYVSMQVIMQKSCKTMGEIFVKLLGKLSGDSDIEVTSLGNVYSWIKERERIVNG